MKEPWEMSLGELEEAAKGGQLGPFGTQNGSCIDDMREEIQAVLDGRKPVYFDVWYKPGSDAEIKRSFRKIAKNVLGIEEDLFIGCARRSGAGVAVVTIGPSQEVADEKARAIAEIDRNHPGGHASLGRILGYSEADICCYYLNKWRRNHGR